MLAIDDRRMRLELGYGLEPVIPDARARSMIDAARPMLRQQDYAGGVRAVVDAVIAATRNLRPDQNLPWSTRAVSLLRGVPDWYVMFYLLGALLCAAPVLPRVRYRIESRAAWAKRRGEERQARARDPAARSWFDALPWHQRLLRNPWTTILLAPALWVVVPTFIALGVPGVRLWNMTLYLVGGALGLLAAVAWHARKRTLAIAQLVVLAGQGVAVVVALQLQPLPGAESGDAETFLWVTIIAVGVPVLLLMAPMTGSSRGTRSTASSARGSSRSSGSSSSSSSGSSSASSYGGGGGRFGGGGASGSW